MPAIYVSINVIFSLLFSRYKWHTYNQCKEDYRLNKRVRSRSPKLRKTNIQIGFDGGVLRLKWQRWGSFLDCPQPSRNNSQLKGYFCLGSKITAGRSITVRKSQLVGQ
ncbi:hypothetical protein RHMOL_Rhmol06G0145000 [Rhododendron molle]|uniref:Uncharacterized protein n=1 Tax=Rhododendron molle TaxID=49168 RepID=A0ACC0ND36_RHOML|nr:hypothetical protein RHMOL_Rhmol06G0145000 [Rhododendron molle]